MSRSTSKSRSRTRRTLLAIAIALLLGSATALIDTDSVFATSAVAPTNPADRDAYGVTILSRDLGEGVPFEESAFLKSARLRADLRDAIVVR